MASLDSLQVKQLAAQNVSVNVVDDAPVALRLKYKGTGTITSVTVDTGTDLEMITSDGGTETFAFATYSNLGLLVDAINASDYWEALLLDGLRTDETVNSDLVNGAKTISSTGFYDLTVDTSTALDSANKHTFAYRCTVDRNPGSTKPKSGRRIRLSEVIYNINVSAAEAKGFRIYEWDAVNKTETLVYQAASVDATATTVNFASGNKTLDAGYGNDLIVKVVDGTSITDDSANFLNCSYTIE
jgi:hypothetical protein